MKHSILLRSAAAVTFLTGVAASTFAQFPDAAASTVTNVTGTITQLNYGGTGEVQGFLIGTNVLLSFPTNICAGIGSLGMVGNSVTYSGTAVAANSGFESVRLSSFTNNATKATYTAPTAASAPTTYGPASGTIKQLNYFADGSINGFLFSPGGSGTSIFVSIGAQRSTTLSTLLTAGAGISVTGTTSPAMSACSATGALEVVDATSLTVNGQTIVITGGGHGGPGGPGPGGPGRH